MPLRQITSHSPYACNTPQWDDLRVPVTASKSGGAKQPTFGQFIDDGAGSQGVYAEAFSASQEQELFFAVQLPHAWKQETDLHAHVHWGTTSTSSSGTVIWGLEYTWHNVFGDIPTTTTITGTHTFGGNEQYKHQLTPLGIIVGTGKRLSSMLLCRIYRAAGSDSFTGTASLFESDFHYQINSLG
jgi:hypothetical protein